MPGKKRNYAEVMLDVYDMDPDTYHKRTKSFPMYMVASRKPVVIGIVKLGRSHIKAWKIRLKGGTRAEEGLLDTPVGDVRVSNGPVAFSI